jgi:flavin reductase (DIM6/NTAB) family NADH-FMN oxidoreductase RutF
MDGISYRPGVTTHGLPYDPFKACVVPRPIGWISSQSPDGIDNLAPFSQFTNVSYDPPSILFCANRNFDGGRKDSVVNIDATGQFVWNLATWALREAVNASAEHVGPEVDEFERAGLAKASSTQVRPPRVAASPIHFECELLRVVTIPGRTIEGTTDVVFGRVVVVHIAPWAMTPDGKVDVLKIKPIARMGYYDYSAVESAFQMIIPGDPRALRGLEGAASGGGLETSEE